MMEISITVPLVPPSVNHYAKHTRSGRHYQTDEAREYKNAVQLCSPPAEETWPMRQYKAYSVEAVIHLGANKKGDVDNFAKVILDGLVQAGLVKSDALITDLTLRKRRDRENPRTEIVVRAL